MTHFLSALRSQRNWLALLVLPALLLRALVPVGFMPTVTAGGGISIEVCPGVTEPASGVKVAAHSLSHAHHHGAGQGAPAHGQGPSTPAHHAPCLFAASAGGALAPCVFELTAPADTVVLAELGSVGDVLLPTIIRAQTSRGPPELS